MKKELPSDILIHVFTLISVPFDDQDTWNPIYLISFSGNRSKVMPSPKEGHFNTHLMNKTHGI